MNNFNFFQKGQNVYVKVEKGCDFHFVIATIAAIDAEMTLLFEDGTTVDYSLEQAEDQIFSKTPIADFGIRGLAKGILSKEELLRIFISDMLSCQFCEQCQADYQTPVQISERVFSYTITSHSIPDFEYAGFVWEGDGETGSTKEIFKYKDRYYTSYYAGNQHEHLAPVSGEAFERIKDRLVLPKSQEAE